jgi:hypothetical protein
VDRVFASRDVGRRQFVRQRGVVIVVQRKGRELGEIRGVVKVLGAFRDRALHDHDRPEVSLGRRCDGREGAADDERRGKEGKSRDAADRVGTERIHA